MRILMLHNYYQIRGGEDISAEAEVKLLRDAGHEVTFLTLHNEAVEENGHIRTAVNCIWSRHSYRRITEELKSGRYDILHAQNIFPLWSPSVFYAARKLGIPTIQTIRNYRLGCLNGLFFRRGVPCERCMRSKLFAPGVFYHCYRGSYTASMTVAVMLLMHRFLRTWNRKISAFICLSHFTRSKLLEMGISPQYIFVKPNFVERLAEPKPVEQRTGFVYAGRLSEEKGLTVLLDAWQKADLKTESLYIVGDGPLMPKVKAAASKSTSIKLLGKQSQESVHRLISSARALVQPSCCYETFGRSIAEALSYGTPVIATDIGAIGDLTNQSYAGIAIPLNDHLALSRALIKMMSDDYKWNEFHSAALDYFQKHLTSSANCDSLITIYKSANR